jgi:OPA family sugar phosphate sensor protein UhpC-like MFS transporter
MWLSYAAYYLNRRGFAVVKKILYDKLDASEVALGRIDTTYLTAYSLGQFVSGYFGDHVGARKLVGYGMLFSCAACVAFGSASGALAFGFFFALNGLAQSTGWPGTTRGIADFTTLQNRGSVMSFFSTSYQVGGFVAVWLAGFLATAFGWRAAFFGPAAVVLAVAIAVLVLYPNPPLATTSITDHLTPAEADQVRLERREARRAVVRSPTIWLLSTSYFFVKLIRYALLFWLPYYLSTMLGYSTLEAAGISTAFDAGGFVGVIVIGLISDRTKRLGRTGLALLWLLGLAVACGAYVVWGSHGKLANVLLLALIGAMLFGPDSLLCGAAAMDAGGPRAAAMSTGFVNGLGSIGPILQGLFLPPFVAHYGWQALFPALVVLALCAALVLLPTLWRTKATRAV